MAEGNRNRTKTVSLGMMTIKKFSKKNGHFSAITVEIIDYCSSRHFNTTKYRSENNNKKKIVKIQPTRVTAGC